LVEFKNTKTLERSFKYNLFTKSIKKFFSINESSQILEKINPSTEITHKRKIAIFTKKNKTNLEIRQIHDSHFTKICPIETVEGKNAGLIWSLTKEARINEFGIIQSPFFM
jgi:DNA-directed RNA polymerase subunit beta